MPDDRIVEDARATVCAIADAEQPARVLVEPTTRLSGVAGRLAAHMGAAVITDVLALGPDGAPSLYFGGAGAPCRDEAGTAGEFVGNCPCGAACGWVSYQLVRLQKKM